MYSSNRNSAGEQVPYGVLQQVLRADQQQNVPNPQPMGQAYGYGQPQSAPYSGRALQQVMQADRPLQSGQQSTIPVHYGTSYAQPYPSYGQGGQGMVTQASHAAGLSQVMQADHVGNFGSSYPNYNTPNPMQGQQSYAMSQIQREGSFPSAPQSVQYNQGVYPNAGVQQVMQADHVAAAQFQPSYTAHQAPSYGSGNLFGSSQPVQVQLPQYPQAHMQPLQHSPQLTQVMQADQQQQNWNGPSRTNYNY